VVDDFGIKYLGCKHAEHLVASIKKYEIPSNLTGNAYCGLKIDWDYNNGTVDLAHAEYLPRTWHPPVYGANTQYIDDKEDSPSLSSKEVNLLQEPGGTLIYYAIAVDPTLIMPVNMLASVHTKATSETVDKIIKLLNYCTTHPDATLH
jgi:hypothetical protein